MADAGLPALGWRVRNHAPLDRYPHFLVEAGAVTGMVIEATDDLIVVQLEQLVEGAEEWDNQFTIPSDEVVGSHFPGVLVTTIGDVFLSYFEVLEETHITPQVIAKYQAMRGEIGKFGISHMAGRYFAQWQHVDDADNPGHWHMCKNDQTNAFVSSEDLEVIERFLRSFGATFEYI
jgi:hypothetical protein